MVSVLGTPKIGFVYLRLSPVGLGAAIGCLDVFSPRYMNLDTIVEGRGCEVGLIMVGRKRSGNLPKGKIYGSDPQNNTSSFGNWLNLKYV